MTTQITNMSEYRPTSENLKINLRSKVSPLLGKISAAMGLENESFTEVDNPEPIQSLPAISPWAKDGNLYEFTEEHPAVRALSPEEMKELQNQQPVENSDNVIDVNF